MKRIEIIGYRGDPLVGYIFKDVASPKAVVQILHGMQEHGKRYEHFARYLNSKGYIVFVSDLRGHGESAISMELQGHHNGDIYEDIINDQIIISNTLNQMFHLPLYVLGHSFGSFVTQAYMTRCHIADKIVLVGSAYTRNSAYKFGNFVAKMNSISMKNKPAKLIERCSFKSYAKKFPNGNWLTHDEDIFNRYTTDPYCGKPFPYSFYRSFFRGALNNYKEIDNIRPDTKILIVSGDEDPVGARGKLTSKLYDIYKKHNLDVTYKLYPGGRHEILNEPYRVDVYNYIIDFFEDRLEK